jgi:AcrR family transcriptional regulator
VKPRDDKKIEAIFAATLALVKDYGLSGITMSMIARKAKLATGTVYLYFTNKEQLITRLFDICANNYAQAYFVDVNPKSDYRKNFRTVWTNVAKYSYNYFEQMVLLEQCFHSPFIPEETRVLAKEKLKPWLAFIEKGKTEGIIKDMDTITLIIYVRGTIREMVKLCHYNHKKLSPALLDKMFNMCWDGITN